MAFHKKPYFFSAVLTGLFALTAPVTGQVPANWPASYPEWWYDVDPAKSMVDVSSLDDPGNLSPILQGQLLHMADISIQELNEQLALVGGSGFTIDDFKDPNETPSYYSPAAIGQLKFVTSKFYNRFAAIGYQPGSTGWNPDIILNEGAGDNSLSYPWKDDQAPDNLSIALIGQSKFLFAWDLKQWVLTDGDINADSTFGDGIPDYWENYWFDDLSYDADDDNDSDGIKNGLEFSLGYDPTSSANSTDVTSIEESVSLKLDWGGQETIGLLINNPTASDVNYTASLAGGQANGYVWEDSISGGATYNWTEISSTGIALTTISNIDDGYAEIIFQQVVIPFYGNEKLSVWVSTNGFLNFQQGSSDYSNDNLPDYSSPYGAIAAFWNDLDTSKGGDIYYQEFPATNPDRLIVQYQDVAKRDNSGVNTFQIVLYTDGVIEFFYKDMNGELNQSSVGIQNISRNQGIELAYNEAYLQNNLAIRFTPTKQLVSITNPIGIIAASSSLELDLNLDKENVFAGTYTGTVSISHDGPGTTPIDIPFQLEIPHAKLTAPTSGYTLFEGESLSSSSNYFRAKVIDAPDVIDEVEFLYATGSVGVDTSPSNDEYTRSWSPVPVGEHEVFARVKLSNGETNDSAPITVVVIPDSDGDKLDDRWEQYYFSGTQETPLGDYDMDGASNLHEYEAGGFSPDDNTQTPQNISSVVTITEPSNNYTVLEGDTINFSATATDEDFGFERIEFWSDLQADVPLFTDTSVSGGSASVNWSGNLVGTHTITAVTVDRYGKVSNPSPSITVVVLPDADDDRMNDDWEAASFGDLSQEASADFDGDRFPNIFEYHHGTLAGNEVGADTSIPVFSSSQASVSPVSEIGTIHHYRVDGISNTTYEKSNIQTALNTADDFDIIEVLPGTYNENIDLNDRVFLFGRDRARATIIDGTNRSDNVIDLNSESVIDGFTVQNGGSNYNISNGGAIYVSAGNNQTDLRVIGCLFVNNEATNDGGAVYVSSGDITFVSCSLIDNLAPNGAAIYSASNNNDIRLINTLLWNDEPTNGAEVQGSITGVVYQNTLYRDTLTGNVFIDEEDQLTRNPGITPYFGIYHDSPAKDKGTVIVFSLFDFDNEKREDGFIDIGVDEMVDSDLDGIADAWMDFYGLTDPNGHADADALTNLQEYQNQTNPISEDTDGDTISDSDEINVYQTNPIIFDDLAGLYFDLNQDGVLDFILIELGFDPYSDDWDGDGLNNQSEAVLGSNPFLADSDGDGFNDGSDAYPIDPTLWLFGTNDPNDTTAPVISILTPQGSQLVP